MLRGWFRLERKVVGGDLELDLVVGRPDGQAAGIFADDLLDLLEDGDRLRVTLALESPEASADADRPGGAAMAKLRLTEVIREEVGEEGVHAFSAFKDLATLKAKFPRVYDAIRDEADLRPTIGGPDKVLETLVRPWFSAEYGPSAEFVDAEPGSRAQPE